MKRIELGLVGALIVLSAALRAWRLSDLGLVHFDEGVYALSGLWAMDSFDNPTGYAKQTLFSPPLFFSLIGTSYWLLGRSSDKAAILVNVVIGAATIALVWWLARCWFGSGPAIAAATMVALSDFHIVYSRMALTDITFGFLYLLSLGVIAVALHKRSLRWAAVAGLVVGGAWNTKYHGWLPLIIALILLVAFVLTGRYERSVWRRLLMCWVVMTAVAVVCYLPWAIYVQTQSGGYLSLMKYQRSFLDLKDWLPNLWRHAEMQWYMDGWVSRLSPVAAYLMALTIRGVRQLRWNEECLTLVALTGAGLFLGGAGTAATLSVLAIPSVVRRGPYFPWLLLISLGLLSLLTPLYHPYPRLALPWLLSIYMVAGAGIWWIIEHCRVAPIEWGSRRTRRSVAVLVTAVAALFGVLSLVGHFRPGPRTWMATHSVRKAATAMAHMLPKDSVVVVNGEPEVAFYLRLADRQAFPTDIPNVVTRLTGGRTRVFLVTGIYSQRAPEVRTWMKRFTDRLDLVAVFPVQPNDVRLLNDFPPQKALQYRLHPTKEYDLHLYEVGLEPKTRALYDLGPEPNRLVWEDS